MPCKIILPSVIPIPAGVVLAGYIMRILCSRVHRLLYLAQAVLGRVLASEGARLCTSVFKVQISEIGPIESWGQLGQRTSGRGR